MAKKILGIDLGHDSIKLALVNGKTVEKTVDAPIPLNLIQDNRVVSEEAMGEFLRDVMKENGIRCSHAAYVFQNENTYSRTIKMPRMTVEQLRVNLPYEFSDFISDEPQKYVYDYAMLPNLPEDEGDTMRLMAVAIQKEQMDSVRRFVKKAGLKIVRAAPTVSAYISLIRDKGDPDREYCILDLGHKAIRMHIFKGERYEVTRTLDIGLSALDDVIAENLNVDVHLAHTYLLSNYENCQNSEYCRSAYDNITMELVRALNFYRFSNPDSNLEDVYISGGGLQNATLSEVIHQTLDLNVHHARELLRDSMNKEGYSTFAQAIGIALERRDLGAISGKKYPVKKEIDIASVGEKKLDIKTALAATILIVVGASIFSYYGVASRFWKLYEAEAAASRTQSQLDEALEVLSGYELTEEEYAHYTFEGMTNAELTQVEREDVLRLLDEHVMGKCEIEYWSVSENILKLRIVGLNLEAVNQILQDINSDELVSYSTVSTAEKEDKTDEGLIVAVTANIEIHLNGQAAGGAE